MKNNMALLTYIKGDVTNPIGDGIKIIPHCCNDIGLWGSGVVKAISKKWLEPEYRYREWFRLKLNKSKMPFALGQTEFVKVTNHIIIANMIGQHGIISQKNPHPICYKALRKCMKRLIPAVDKATIHAPKFGSLRAGGEWKMIEKMIEEEWIINGLNVIIYELD